VKILLWIILKVHALHYANKLLVRVRLSFTFLFINICKLAHWQQEETTRKKMCGKDKWLVLVVNKSTDHDNPHFHLLFTTSKNFFQVQSASWKRHCATYWCEKRGWTLIENSKLVNQIARLAAIVVKLNTPLFRCFYNHLSNYTKHSSRGIFTNIHFAFGE